MSGPIFYVTRCFGRHDGAYSVIYEEADRTQRSVVSLTRLEVGQRFELVKGLAVPVERVANG